MRAQHAAKPAAKERGVLVSKRHDAILPLLKQQAIAVLFVDPNGKLISDPIWHLKGGQAPFKLIAIVEEGFDGEEELLAEIGVGRAHPYRGYHVTGTSLDLPRRASRRSPSRKQVQALVPDLTTYLNRIVHARSTEWGLVREWRGVLHNVQRNDRFLPGVAFSVHDRDVELRRFFEEWELANRLDLEYRLDRYAWVLNNRPKARRPTQSTARRRYMHRWAPNYRRRKGYPDSYFSFRHEVTKASSLNTIRLMLRPHILGLLGRRLFDSQQFFQFLLDYQVVEDLGMATKVVAHGIEATYGFHVLPRHAVGLSGKEFHARADTLAVSPLNRFEEYTTFRVSLKSSEWARRQEEEREKIDYRESLLRRIAREAREEFGNGNGAVHNHVVDGFEIPVLSPDELVGLGGAGIGG